MKLNHICGQTYVIDGSTQVGVYLFHDDTCLLIDSGPADEAGQIRQIIEEQKVKVRAIINTHYHADHCGGNREFQLQHQSLVYASAPGAPMIEHPILQPIALYSACPPKILHNRYIMPPESKVHNIISPGPLIINGGEFRIEELEGHALGHIGIETPDGVFFAGDSLLPLQVLQEFPFLYLHDAGRQTETLECLKKRKHQQLYLAHGGHPDDVEKVIQANQTILENMLQIILAFITEGRTREDITAYVIEKLRLPFNQSQYYLLMASVSACLSYLCLKKMARSFAVDHLIKFQRKSS